MSVRFTPLGKGSNRRSWHLYAPASHEFKELYQSNEMFRLYFDKLLEEPLKQFLLKADDGNRT